jgi:hypothetical protein
MKISKVLAIGCAALMGLTATTPVEARSYRRVRIDDDGRRVVRTVRSRPRVVYRGTRYRNYPRYSRYYRSYPRYSRYYRSYPRYSRYYRSYPRYSRYYRSPRYVRYVRQPRYYSRWNTYPSYYYSGYYPSYYSGYYPSYYGSPFYYGSPYYYGSRGGISISFGGGRYWGW